MRSRRLREADNIAHAFNELAASTRHYKAAPESEDAALSLHETFAAFVSLIRGEIAHQTKLEERE